MKKKKTIKNILAHTVLTVLAIVWVSPLVWIILTSFRAQKGAYTSSFFPKSYSLDNYIKLFTDTGILNFPRMFTNTLIVAVFSCIISTFFVLSVAYCMSRLKFKMRKAMMNVAMILGLFPAFMAMIAVYYILKAIGLSEGSMIRVALVLVYSASAGIQFYIAKGFFDTIPKTIDEAALIDGATKWQVFTKITIPLSKPIIVYTVLTSFIAPWVDFMLDIIFASFNAYPKQWIENDDGQIVYGSVTDEAKNALEYINQLYNEKIIDNDFLLRTSTNICELIENGLCGSFFGPWWAPNNPLANAVSINPDSNWQPYLISTGDNVTEYHSQNPCYKYVVVRKGYEYPEIAAKMISVMFDKIRFDCADSEEFDNYYQLNVEPTARPLSINVDYNNALSICYRNISDAIEGRKDSDNLELLERSYYNACKSYLNNTGLANTSYEYNTDDSYKEYSQSGRKGATSTQWAAYMSRIKACRLLDEGNIVIKQSLYFKTTDTMKNRWWKLKSLEKEAYLKIISGEADIDYFDTFVSEWNAQGGIIITEEVRENIVR